MSAAGSSAAEKVERRAGVLLPLGSLPSPHGIGDMGGAAYRFVEALAEAGAAYWQILPLNPLGFGNSPYQPYSSYAGDPIYISLNMLYEQGLLSAPPPPLQDAGSIAYPVVRAYKEGLLREAFQAFSPDEAYEAFIAQEWVYPYAVFMALKRGNDLRCWNTWPDAQKRWARDRALDLTPFEQEIRWELFVQYQFCAQWTALKERANDLGVGIIGDIPMYVGLDSADVWAGQENFLLNEKGEPPFVAGVPPDYFSPTGQRWGNPLYDWAALTESGFRFWIQRLRYASRQFDILRIDHFRGFDTYWKIPAACPTAVEGEWMEAPGYAMFDAALEAVPDLAIIAEDLGMLREEVYKLRDRYGFRGMNVLQFTLDPARPLTAAQGPARMVIYTGTHDNQTLQGWYRSRPLPWRLLLRFRLFQAGYRRARVAERLVRLALDNPADIAILPAADIMGMDDGARINTPGTVGPPNWQWKLEGFKCLEEALQKLSVHIRESGRSGKSDLHIG